MRSTRDRTPATYLGLINRNILEFLATALTLLLHSGLRHLGSASRFCQPIKPTSLRVQTNPFS